MLCSSKPKSPREWQAVLGVNNQQFALLLKYCTKSFKELNDTSFEEELLNNSKGHLAKIKTLEDLIFFTLVILKTGITFDFAAFLMQFDQSRAHRHFIKGINLIHYTLDIEGLLPIREIATPNEFEEYFDKKEILIFDATEQRIQRPQQRDYQNDTYSGKKKMHTIKSMIISDLSKYIHYVSLVYIGKTHDFSLLKEEFPPSLEWFNQYQIRVDLAYLGFLKDYPNAQLYIPHKKPKGKELTEQQKDENRELARERISVEHSIGGMKRYDILSNTCRIHNIELYDKILAVCAGLWNFCITN